MNSAIVVWISGALGWDPGPTLAVLLVIAGLAALTLMWAVFYSIGAITDWCLATFRAAGWKGRLLLVIPLTLLMLVCYAIIIIGHLAAIISVIIVATLARDWVMKGNK